MQGAILQLTLEKKERRELLRIVDNTKTDESELLASIFRPHAFDAARAVKNLTNKQMQEQPAKEGKKTKAETTIMKFTEKEISLMAKTFKKEFIANGLVARVIKRQSGKRSYCYEIRYRSNGYNISASSTDLTEAKKKFLEKTLPENIGNYCINPQANNATPTNFEKFALFYFESFRKRKVAERTYKNDLNRLKRHIIPVFRGVEIKKIAPSDCQELLDNLMEQDKCKTAVEVYNLLSCIFKTAIAHDLIIKNPLAVVLKPTYDQEHGTALTKDEETRLLAGISNTTIKTAVALALFCGLRPNELETAEIYGKFIRAVNSKRRKKDKQSIEYKYIPITKKLKPFISDSLPKIPTVDVIRKCFNKILPDHILYDCRTTFYSRCKECKVDQRALDEFMGHSLGKLGNAYTDLPLDFLLKEAEKIMY